MKTQNAIKNPSSGNTRLISVILVVVLFIAIFIFWTSSTLNGSDDHQETLPVIIHHQSKPNSKNKQSETIHENLRIHRNSKDFLRHHHEGADHHQHEHDDINIRKKYQQQQHNHDDDHNDHDDDGTTVKVSINTVATTTTTVVSPPGVAATDESNNNSQSAAYYYSHLPPHPDILLAKKRSKTARKTKNSQQQQQQQQPPARSYSRLVAVEASAPDIGYSRNATLSQCLQLCDMNPKCNYVVRNVSFVTSSLFSSPENNSNLNQHKNSRGPAPCWLKLAVVLNTAPNFDRETWVVSRAPQPKIAIGLLSAPKFVASRLSGAFATWLKNEDAVVMLEENDEARKSVKKYFGRVASEGRPSLNPRAGKGSRVLFLFEEEDKQSAPGAWKNLLLMKKLPFMYKKMMGRRLERYERNGPPNKAMMMHDHPKNRVLSLSPLSPEQQERQRQRRLLRRKQTTTTMVTPASTTSSAILSQTNNENDNDSDDSSSKEKINFLLQQEEKEENASAASTTTVIAPGKISSVNNKKSLMIIDADGGNVVNDVDTTTSTEEEEDDDNINDIDPSLYQDPNEPDWYFIVDDDSFVLMRNLRFALAVALPYEASYTGLMMVAADYTRGHPFIQGGAGIVFSQNTYAKTLSHLDCCIDLCKQRYGDFRTGCCVVQATRMSPTLHKGFYSYSPWENSGTDMRKKYGYPMFPISFHRVRLVKMMFMFQQHIDRFLENEAVKAYSSTKKTASSSSTTPSVLATGSKYRMVPSDRKYRFLRNQAYYGVNTIESFSALLMNNNNVSSSTSGGNKNNSNTNTNTNTAIHTHGSIPQNRREWAFVDDLISQRVMRNLKPWRGVMKLNSSINNYNNNPNNGNGNRSNGNIIVNKPKVVVVDEREEEVKLK